MTALVVAAAGLLTRQLPTLRTSAGLTLVMLPAQLAIGSLNDWADVAADSAAKPFKPIARGQVARRSALLFSLTGFAVSLATALWLGPAVLGVAALGIAAGVGYDLVLKRTPAAVLAWWAGFLTVPLLAMVTVGHVHGAADAIPLAGLVALALQIANGLPDSEGDHLAGARTLAFTLGPTRGRCVTGAALAVAAALVLADRGRLAQGSLAALAAVMLAAGALLALLSRAAPRLAFPLLAVLGAGATVSWLAALPAPEPG